MSSADEQVIKPDLTGSEAEDFVEFFSKRTFLKPWVFRSPKFIGDNKELTDIAVLFRDTLILIQVKGNRFDPKNPQRYLNEARKRHEQLRGAERMVKNNIKKVKFCNDYFSFETDFSKINKIHLISISTGPGEMELASGAEHIDYSKLNQEEVGKYLGFFNNEENIHSFTASEMVFASKHIDTLKDFFWYLDFEKKFFNNEFSIKKEGQIIIPVVDAHREDLISIYILKYYWDEELNKTGNIDLNKILGKNIDLEKVDMVMYAGTDTRKYLEDDETYKKIKKEKEISYFWDGLINYVITNYEYAYKITSESPERKKINVEELKTILEEMSFTSRFERVNYSEQIKEADYKKLNFRNMFSLANESDTLFSYAKIEYQKFPTQTEQEQKSYQHLYNVWCRIEFGEKLKSFKDKIKKTLLITRHVHKNESAFSFALSTKILVDEKRCRDSRVI